MTHATMIVALLYFITVHFKRNKRRRVIVQMQDCRDIAEVEKK